MSGHGQGWRDQENERQEKGEREDMEEWVRTTQGIINAVVFSVALLSVLYVLINGWPV